MTALIVPDTQRQTDPAPLANPSAAAPGTVIPDFEEWAQQQWGAVDLGDARRNRRAVQMGQQMARMPGATLPQQLGAGAPLKAAYRRLANEDVHYTQLSQPHWAHTRQAAAAEAVVLLVQDITELDYTAYAATMQGLGPIGDGRGRGLLLHSTLAVVPETAQVLGLLHQQVFLRVLHPEGAARRQRPKAERESRVWGEAVQAIGAAPAGRRWVVVADRAADDIAFLTTCRAVGLDYVVRMTYERRLDQPGVPAYLLTTARSWTPVVGKTVAIRAKGGRPGRQAHVLLSYGRVRLNTPGAATPVETWIVRVWEEDPPEGLEALEWILATSVPVTTAADALERCAWYGLRWEVEDYHQCLKTGCDIEHRDFADAERVKRLLGFLAPLAVRLLQLRQTARIQPDVPASALVEPLMVAVLAAKCGQPARGMTARTFWRSVARLGGFLGRRGDGEPGWKTIWRGWFYLQTLVEGARLAATLRGP